MKILMALVGRPKVRAEDPDESAVEQRFSSQPSWAQVLALISLLSGGSWLGGQQYARTMNETSHEDVLTAVRELKTTIERLDENVRTLSTKVAVLEDREDRNSRLRR